ncbi:39S ribosomal protein L43, mitochondrial [Halotydeus destructor]|nr:39S ribosomal protein L43, mitochondrial [Halotydeus destructor]
MSRLTALTINIAGKQVQPKLPEKIACNLEAFGHNKNQPSGHLKNAYYQGLGRYICQLQRVTVKFSKSGGTSKGARDFIESDIVDFSRNNPSVVVYLKPRKKPTPVLICEYVNGTRHWMNLKNFNRDEIVSWLDYYVTRCGDQVKRYRKPNHTDWPTIQGMWTPFTHIPTELNVSEFPQPLRAEWKEPLPSATEQLLKIIEENKLKSMILSEHPTTAK